MQEVVAIHFLDVEENVSYQELIQKVVQTCFTQENLNALNLYMSVTLTTPEHIRILNGTYRKINKETDVLSFPMFDKKELDLLVKEQIPLPIQEILGDIVISIERVQQQAEEYGHSFERELAYMLVHGFYHLMGYDHIEEQDKMQMRPKEEKILEQLHITRD
ncbi:MAG: rRNA maturation RNase YbeY [Clostridia bacterium]